MINITPRRQLEIALVKGVTDRYSGLCPVGILVEDSLIFAGSYEVKLSVAGQTRSILISRKKLTAMETFDEILDEILFATFLLLDEDQDDL